ncbi:MAG: hypothetical protein NXI24_11565 [bacterium]|nr:hypothetical protein [bacterium]
MNSVSNDRQSASQASGFAALFARSTFLFAALSAAAFALFATTACGGPQGPQALQQTLQTHGGLGEFRSFKGVSYDLTNWPFAAVPPINDRQTIDLSNRTVHISGTNSAGGAYTLGFDGKEAWIDDPAALGLPARFYYNTPFYFFAMPFVFADPGVTVSPEPDFTNGDKSYRVVKITYGAGVGDSPEDDYILYLDQTSGRIEFAHYIVSYKALAGGKPAADLERHVVVFDWQSADGLVVPAKFHFHAYDPEKIVGEKLASVGVENVKFSKTRPDQALFQKPAGASVDSSHE